MTGLVSTPSVEKVSARSGSYGARCTRRVVDIKIII